MSQVGFPAVFTTTSAGRVDEICHTNRAGNSGTERGKQTRIALTGKTNEFTSRIPSSN